MRQLKEKNIFIFGEVTAENYTVRIKAIITVKTTKVLIPSGYHILIGWTLTANISYQVDFFFFKFHRVS